MAVVLSCHLDLTGLALNDVKGLKTCQVWFWLLTGYHMQVTIGLTPGIYFPKVA